MAHWLIREKFGERAAGQARAALPNGVFGAAVVRRAALEATDAEDLLRRLQAISRNGG